MNKFENKSISKRNYLEDKKKITMQEMSNLDPENREKEGNLANVVYVSLLLKGNGFFTKKSLINLLVSSGNEGNTADRLIRAQKTVANFIKQGYLELDKTGKIISRMEIGV